jgi:hypothetical protein
MNRTQKSALFNLSGFVVNIAFFCYLFVTIFVYKSLPNRTAEAIWLPVLVLLFGSGLLLLRKKQSPVEPQADERDKAIMKNAVLVSFVATWLLLAAATVVPALTLGEAGAVPVYLLPFINWGVFVGAGIVYTVAILVQYGRTEKETNHE